MRISDWSSDVCSSDLRFERGCKLDRLGCGKIGDAFSKKDSGHHLVLRQAWGGGEGDLRILRPAGNVENAVDVLHAGARLNADDGIVDFTAAEIDFSFVQRYPDACKAVGAAQQTNAAVDAGQDRKRTDLN